MLAAFDKYRHAFLVGLQSNLVYRVNFALRGFFSLFHLAAIFILWGAAYMGQETLGGYQFLLKPINYFGYRFSIFLAARLVSGGLVLIPLAVAMPVIYDSLSFPAEPWRIAVGLPAMALSAMIQFSIAYCFGLLTFWFLEIQGFVILSMAFETLLGGQMFPLDLLPAWAYKLASFLPFYYQMYFPAAIFTGRLSDPHVIAQGFAIQAGWVVLLLAFNQWLWVRGLRRHTAVGG
jgi:ABC-2 type transport system permease protein